MLKGSREGAFFVPRDSAPRQSINPFLTAGVYMDSL